MPPSGSSSGSRPTRPRPPPRSRRRRPRSAGSTVTSDGEWGTPVTRYVYLLDLQRHTESRIQIWDVCGQVGNFCYFSPRFFGVCSQLVGNNAPKSGVKSQQNLPSWPARMPQRFVRQAAGVPLLVAIHLVDVLVPVGPLLGFQLHLARRPSVLEKVTCAPRVG